ncbi:3-keto-disaccharide hydrolase [Segetibacter koreensis]|uniref:3-keto-disaccharide hydrolase n=1 Tax=Segetibacter koreensis TaxID=398037 RepID=UPI00035FEDE8|nr:DUF1080 domain-containing protein [Segetibacter koreensis]
MRTKVFLVGVLVAAIAFSSYTYKMTADNTLSKAERQQGWKLLFDGKSKNGWRYYQNKPSKSWEVSNGTLHSKGSAANYGSINADLMTKEQYDNFELSIDWKISPKGNSGILYLVTEDNESSYLSGPEYQIIDDINFPEKIEDWQKTGANYALNPAPTAEPNPVGQWNHTKIVVNKGHVEHWLNGKKIVEYEIGSEEWKKNKMNGKFKDAAGYGMAKKGYIALQDHGSEAWFKNIKIKQL